MKRSAAAGWLTCSGAAVARERRSCANVPSACTHKHNISMRVLRCLVACGALIKSSPLPPTATTTINTYTHSRICLLHIFIHHHTASCVVVVVVAKKMRNLATATTTQRRASATTVTGSSSKLPGARERTIDKQPRASFACVACALHASSLRRQSNSR